MIEILSGLTLVVKCSGCHFMLWKHGKGFGRGGGGGGELKGRTV